MVRGRRDIDYAKLPCGMIVDSWMTCEDICPKVEICSYLKEAKDAEP